MRVLLLAVIAVALMISIIPAGAQSVESPIATPTVQPFDSPIGTPTAIRLKAFEAR